MSKEKTHYERMVDTELQHVAERCTTEESDSSGEGKIEVVNDAAIMKEIATLRVDIKLMERRKKDV